MTTTAAGPGRPEAPDGFDATGLASRIAAAAGILAGQIHLTPVLGCRSLDAAAGVPLRLKCENLQRAGSFKVRGALHKVSCLPAAERARGVITYSSGNHAQGVALAASIVGVPATVVVPEDAVAAKVSACRGYGAEVVFAGRTSDDRRAAAERIAADRGLAMVPPFDDPDVVAGQGTIGLEVLRQAPDAAAVFVPIGGGGLISGIALAVKARAAAVRVIGVEPEGAGKAFAARRAGRPIRLERTETIADGLRPLALGNLNHAVIAAHVDELITVSDEAIRAAVALLLERAKLVVEPSGAVSLAGALVHARRFGPRPSAVVLSGGNLDFSVLRG